MKTLIWHGATAVIVGVAAMISGQSDIPNGSRSSSSYIQTSRLVGRKVKSSEGTEIGVVKDVVIDFSNGCMAYTVVSTGGAGTDFISGGGKIVAIPWTVYSPTSDLSVLTVNVDREKIYHAPAFEYSRMDEFARPDYMNNVYSYYGVSPGPRTAVAASNGAKAGTDVTGTAGATASPGEVASPAAGETGSPNKKPSARTHASSTANSYGASGANPSLKAIRSAKAINTRPSIGRGETASPAITEKFPSESTTSPNENKNRGAKLLRTRLHAGQARHQNRPKGKTKRTDVLVSRYVAPLLATD
jgi:sporulation protein YlmC with PRC-barrel domain